MRTRLVAIVLLAVAISSGQILFACGDKFLILSRGTRFQRAEAPRAPATILVYANPVSPLAAAFAGVSAEATLQHAGYRPEMVTSVEALQRALGRGGWDLVIVDLVESRSIGVNVRGETGPALLAVAYKLTGAELEQAKQQHALVLKAPIKRQALLDAVDAALARRKTS
jgi:hypothetical protein